MISNNDRFTVIANGNTFPCKQELKSWGFQWVQEKKHWVLGCCDGGEVQMFKNYVSLGRWGVKLEITKEEKTDLDRILESGESPL